MKCKARLALFLSLCALASSLSLFSQASSPASPSGSSEPLAQGSLASLPPFDQERVYQVPGAMLEKLRLDWLMLSDKLASSQTALQEAREQLALAQTRLDALQEPLAMLNQSLKTSAHSFDAYRTETSLEVWFWRVLSVAGWGSLIYEQTKR